VLPVYTTGTERQKGTGWVEPFAKPITVQEVMGIASLHPSYRLLAKTLRQTG